MKWEMLARHCSVTQIIQARQMNLEQKKPEQNLLELQQVARM